MLKTGGELLANYVNIHDACADYAVNVGVLSSLPCSAYQ